MAWLSKILETPDQTAQRKADEARQRSEWREIEAIEADKARSFWRTWADT